MVVTPLVQRFARWPEADGKAGVARLSYRGRKSGKEISLVVAVRRTAEGAVVEVAAPSQKRWWRNFTGTPAPATLTACSGVHSGMGLAARGAAGTVTVHFTFE